MEGGIEGVKGRAEVLVGHALALPVKDRSVQCVVTSPPYWGLRKYAGQQEFCWDEGTPEEWIGALGLEPTPEMYVRHLVQVFRDVRRVLRDDGVCWLNLGDSYANTGVGDISKVGGFTGEGIRRTLATGKKSGTWQDSQKRDIPPGLKPKDLVGIPWRVAFALQADGWYLRSDIIWAKPNPMPESVTDRPTKAHEYIFLLTKSAKYYYDHEAIKETAIGADRVRADRAGGNKHNERTTKHSSGAIFLHAGTRNARSVWTIAPKPYRGAHFATFPPELPRRCILASTPEGGCCASCGAPRKRVIEKGAPIRAQQVACGGDAQGNYAGQATKDFAVGGAQDASAVKARILAGMVTRRTIGWAKTCRCATADTRPAYVLDPFGGSGVTAMIARELGRVGLSVDVSEEYAALARDRINGREREKVADKQAGHSRRHAGFNARWKEE